jgi:hypothetical protein
MLHPGGLYSFHSDSFLPLATHQSNLRFSPRWVIPPAAHSLATKALSSLLGGRPLSFPKSGKIFCTDHQWVIYKRLALKENNPKPCSTPKKGRVIHVGQN